jgi:hypothetical protein
MNSMLSWESRAAHASDRQVPYRLSELVGGTISSVLIRVGIDSESQFQTTHFHERGCLPQAPTAGHVANLSFQKRAQPCRLLLAQLFLSGNRESLVGMGRLRKVILMPGGDSS